MWQFHFRNRVFYKTSAGGIDCFDYMSDMTKSLGRQKAIGILSHVSAQQQCLRSWFAKSPAKNAVATQMVSG